MKCEPGCTCGRHQWGNQHAAGWHKGCPPGCECGKHNNPKYREATRHAWAQRYADPQKMAAYQAKQRAARQRFYERTS